MGIYDYFRRFLPTPKPQAAQPQPQERVQIRALPGGRASLDTSDTMTLNSWLIMPPDNYESNWQLINLSGKDFEQLAPTKLLEVLADLSPEVSRALWDFLRLMNPGYTARALRVGSDEQDDVAQAALMAFIDQMSDQHGAFDIVIGRINIGAFLRGALCAELVLDKRGRMPLDIATPDPATVRFRKRTDPERGEVWQAGQWQARKFEPLDIPTFRYVPIDPLPGSPYGRPIAAPALFTALFLLGMMHDLRRVIQQQGYPRLDLEIDVEQILQIAPQIASSTELFNDFVSDLVSQVSTVYSALQPDDAYIHTSNVKVNRPVGASGNGNLAGIDAVIVALERMCVRALKTMPLMMGITDSVGDVQSNRQWEIHIAGIKSMQHYCETMLERLLTLALQAQGIQADVEFRFAEIRDAERMRDAQAEAMEIANTISKRDQGWMSQEEASEIITGSLPVGPAPVQQTARPEIVNGSTDGLQLNSAALAQIRMAQRTVKEAIDVVRTNGYHASN